jgi:hypothetical protein
MLCRATRANKPETFAPPSRAWLRRQARWSLRGNTAKIGGPPYTESVGVG